MKSLLTMDDVNVSLNNLDVQILLKNLINNRRHYRVSIICLVQSYNAMPLAIRKTISHLAYYTPRNKPYSFLSACADTNELYK